MIFFSESDEVGRGIGIFCEENEEVWKRNQSLLLAGGGNSEVIFFCSLRAVSGVVIIFAPRKKKKSQPEFFEKKRKNWQGEQKKIETLLSASELWQTNEKDPPRCDQPKTGLPPTRRKRT